MTTRHDKVCHTFTLAELLQFVLIEIGMTLDLIDDRHCLRFGHQFLDLCFVEVGHTYRFDETLFDTVLQSFPALSEVYFAIDQFTVRTFGEELVINLCERHGTVYETEVNVCHLKLIQYLLHAFHRSIFLEVSQPYFGNDEQFLSLHLN